MFKHVIIQEKYFTLAAWLLFAAFSALAINHAFFFTMDADEAFNAGIAKNWLAGYGYSSSLGIIFPFDAYISSGPAYTFIQAVPIYFWGNNPDMQKPFIAVINLLLFANILRMIRPRFKFGLQFFLFVAFCIGSYALLEFKFWHRPAGELLSLLYFLTGALLLSGALDNHRYGHCVIAGFFIACACLTKTQAFLWFVGVLLASMIFYWRTRERFIIKLLVLFLLAFLPPVLIWEYYKMTVMTGLAQSDPQLYQYALGKDWHFFSTHGSGVYLSWEVESWRDLWRRFTSTPQLAFGKFHEIFSFYGPLAVVYAAAVPLLSLWLLFRQDEKNGDFLFLSIPLFLFMLWAFLLNNSVYTHQMLPGVWFWIFLLALRLARFPLLLGFLTVVNVAILTNRALHHDEESCLLTRDAACIHVKPNPIRISFNKTLSYIQSRPAPVPLANCGWYFSQDIEFALPGVNHIQDCMRLFDAAVVFDADAFVTKNKLSEDFRTHHSADDLIKIYVNKRKNLFGASFVAPVQWRKPLTFTFVAGIYMMGDSLEQKRNVMSFLEHCHGILYKDRFYSIQECSYQDLQEYVNEWGGLPIFTHEWEALYYADFMYTTKVLRKNPVHMRSY
jgi:hypothetical protein